MSSYSEERLHDYLILFLVMCAVFFACASVSAKNQCKETKVRKIGKDLYIDCYLKQPVKKKAEPERKEIMKYRTAKAPPIKK